jgi:hypothetical protein
MASIVDSTTRPDVEDFKFDGILAEDHAEIADPEATMSCTHSDHHVGKRVRIPRVVFNLTDNSTGHIPVLPQSAGSRSRIPDRFHRQTIANFDN